MISPEGTTDTDGHRTAVHILISSEVTEKSACYECRLLSD